jgi:peptidoglycan/LPS O-acetylase OafA/YrhL
MAQHVVDHTHRTHKSRKWTYLIVGVVIILGAVVANFAMNNPELAKQGVDTIAGLPSWAFPAGAAALGALLFYVGLKLEADWPEYLGSALVAGSIVGAEVLLGWSNFEFGGIVVIPYAIPALVLIVLLMISNAKTK